MHVKRMRQSHFIISQSLAVKGSMYRRGLLLCLTTLTLRLVCVRPHTPHTLLRPALPGLVLHRCGCSSSTAHGVSAQVLMDGEGVSGKSAFALLNPSVHQRHELVVVLWESAAGEGGEGSCGWVGQWGDGQIMHGGEQPSLCLFYSSFLSFACAYHTNMSAWRLKHTHITSPSKELARMYQNFRSTPPTHPPTHTHTHPHTHTHTHTHAVSHLLSRKCSIRGSRPWTRP